MPRGSKPGERRGGRRRGTPNRRSILTDRILAAASGNPAASCHELLSILMGDRALPAATRIDVTRKACASGTSHSNRRGMRKSVALAKKSTESSTEVRDKAQANGDLSKPGKAAANRAKASPAALAMLEVLFRVAQDNTASQQERRKAASEAAQHFLPKNPGGPRRRKFPADECGFSVDPQLARELCDAKLKLACLPSVKKTTPDAFARKVRKIHDRIEEIRQSLQCPGPEKYRTKDVKMDYERLRVLRGRRMSGAEFLPEDDLEEANLTARYDSFLVGPEVAARKRLLILRQKKRIADNYGPSLTPMELTNFRFLSLLFPPPRPKSFNDMPEEHRKEILADHPFVVPRYVEGDPNRPDGFLIFGTPKANKTSIQLPVDR